MIQDAAKESDKERERLIEIQRLCESKKREMIDQESLLRTKQAELDMAINRAKQKEVITRKKHQTFILFYTIFHIKTF